MNKNVFMEIFLRSDLPEIEKLCSLNKSLYQYCNDEYFWRLKAKRDFGIDNVVSTTWKSTYINRYNLPHHIPVESWIRQLHNNEDKMHTDKFRFLDGYFKKILALKNHIQENLYYIVDGYTILDLLIYLYGAWFYFSHVYPDNTPFQNNLQNEIFNVCIRILDAGYDVNKDRNDNGYPLISPLTFLLNGSFDESTILKFAEILLPYGLNLNKTNLWDGFMYHDSYRSVYETHAGPISGLSHQTRKMLKFEK